MKPIPDTVWSTVASVVNVAVATDAQHKALTQRAYEWYVAGYPVQAARVGRQAQARALAVVERCMDEYLSTRLANQYGYTFWPILTRGV